MATPARHCLYSKFTGKPLSSPFFLPVAREPVLLVGARFPASATAGAGTGFSAANETDLLPDAEPSKDLIQQFVGVDFSHQFSQAR